MTNEKRLIDRNEIFPNGTFFASAEDPLKSLDELIKRIWSIPTVDAVLVEQYKALLDMYHDLRENFIDYVCSGTCNVAPYCLNRCEGCVDRVGWCSQGSDECHGFNPAEIII